jgi:phage-related holin
LVIFVWEKGTGFNIFTEYVIWEYLYGKRELGLTVVLNLWVVNICMGKGNWVNGCTECVASEYLYGKRELGLTVVLNVWVVNIFMGKGNWG